MEQTRKVMKLLDENGNAYVVLEDEQKMNITYVGRNTYLVEIRDNRGYIVSSYRLRYNLITLLKGYKIKHVE